jgi:hypothetical protein
VATGPASSGPVRRPAWDDVGLRTGVGVGVEDGRIALIAPDDEVGEWFHSARSPDSLVDCGGRLITDGLVDPHTHALFGKPRLEDQARRARGDDYKAIAAAGVPVSNRRTAGAAGACAPAWALDGGTLRRQKPTAATTVARDLQRIHGPPRSELQLLCCRTHLQRRRRLRPIDERCTHIVTWPQQRTYNKLGSFCRF